MKDISLNPNSLYRTLYNNYGPQGWWPLTMNSTHIIDKDSRGYHKNLTDSTDIFEIITGAILTQNTSWKNAEISLNNLKQNGIVSFEAFLGEEEDKLKTLLKSSGYYNQKYKKLKLALNYLKDNSSGDNLIIPDRDDLLQIWGIGEETADCILLYAYSTASFVIDKYTQRITERLMPAAGEKLKKYKDYKKYYEENIETDAELYKEYHALIVKHSVELCRKKPLCNECFLKESCSYTVS